MVEPESHPKAEVSCIVWCLFGVGMCLEIHPKTEPVGYVSDILSVDEFWWLIFRFRSQADVVFAICCFVLLLDLLRY